MQGDRRKYPRVRTSVRVWFRKEHINGEARDYLLGIAGNCGLGGMFLQTDQLLSMDDIVHLKFEIETAPETLSTIRARTVVRWVRRLISPLGMGLEFIEFEGLGERTLAEWTELLFEESTEEEEELEA